jgi:hypothetical protein
MSYVPNERISWHRWNAIGMALYAATNGHDRGLVAFTLWTARGGYKDAESACTDRWLAYGNCPPDRIGAGSVFHLAGQHGYQPKAPRRLTLADFDPEREERRRREQVSAGLRDFKSTL